MGSAIAGALLLLFISAIAYVLGVGRAATGGAGTAVTLDDLLWLAPFVPFPFVGALIISRRPRNAIGYLLMAIGLSLALGLVGDVYARRGLVDAPGSVPHPELGLVVGAGIVVALPLILLLVATFPEGRLPSSRWRLPVVLGFAGFGLMILLEVVGPTAPFELPDGPMPNPLAIPGLHDRLAVAEPVLTVLMVTFAVTAFLAPIVRFRRSRGIERQQIKWLAAAALLFPIVLFTTSGLRELGLLPDLAVSLFGWALPGIALSAAIAVAVLRYRLYEIDRLLSRTLSYTVVTGLLVGTYASATLVLGQLLTPITRQSDVTVAASTLLVAAVFRPVRRRVQSIVDRRFNRARYDARSTVAEFATRLRDEVDLDELAVELSRAVRTTVAPAALSVWVREAGP